MQSLCNKYKNKMSESGRRERVQPKTWFDAKLEESPFIPKNEEEYRKMLTRAMREHPLKGLSMASADSGRYKYYENLYKTCQKIREQSKIDLRDPENLKVYLACRKICKRGFGIVIRTRLGIFDERSPLLAADSKIFYEFVKKVTNDRKLKSLYISFCSLIYENGDKFKMIPVEDRERAEEIAGEIYKKKLREQYGVDPESVILDEPNNPESIVTIHEYENQSNDWCLQVFISKTELDRYNEDLYSPLFVVKSHELGHVMQTIPGINGSLTKQIRFLAELAPTIELIVLQDEIYKKIHGIPLEEEVDYGTEIPLGYIANRFRDLKQEIGCRSFEDVLLYDAMMHESEVIQEILDICMTKEEQDERFAAVALLYNAEISSLSEVSSLSELIELIEQRQRLDLQTLSNIEKILQSHQQFSEELQSHHQQLQSHHQQFFEILPARTPSSSLTEQELQEVKKLVYSASSKITKNNIIKQENMKKCIEAVLSKQTTKADDEYVKSISEYAAQVLKNRSQGKKDENTRERK